MCNRYEPPPAAALQAYFKVNLPGQPYRPFLGPKQDGPFIRNGVAEVGQWGLIPWFSKTRAPAAKDGRPLMTNNARSETIATAPTFKDPWKRGQRCLVPANSFDEPFWGTGKNIWWRFRRADGAPWAIAGIWADWTDPETGEMVLSYTMVTMNADDHPLMRQMHRKDEKRPVEKQDKRSVVPLDPSVWDQWLNGTPDEAMAALALPSLDIYAHGPADNKIVAPLLF